MKNKIYMLLVFIVLLFVILIYFPLTRTFYLQDEWLGYGLSLIKGRDMVLESTGGLLGIIFGQGRIFTNFLLFMFYKYYPLDAYPISIFAISFHILNTLLVFLLSRKIFKNNWASFFGTLLFSFNSVQISAISWSAASTNTLPSTTLILISLLFYFKFIENSKNKWLILCFLTIYLSLFFKETGIFLFLFLPIYSFLFRKQTFVNFIKSYWYFILATLLIVSYRIFGFKSVSGEEALFLTGSSKYFIDSILVRSVMYPITSFSLSIVPVQPILNFARYLTNVYYPLVSEAQFNLILQTNVLDLIAVLLSIVIYFVSSIFYRRSDDNDKQKAIFWSSFIFASFLPYVIISKSFSYLESRYYYLSTIGWSMIFTWYFKVLIEKYKNRLTVLFVFVIYILFIFVHINAIKSEINKLVVESQIRISILKQFSSLVPRLDNDKNIFYITGNTDYYILGNKVPFQQGFGYTLLTYYYPKSKYNQNFLKVVDLFEIGKQGYYEKDSNGFGYFSNLETMQEEMKKYKIPVVNVYKFHFDSKSGQISILK